MRKSLGCVVVVAVIAAILAGYLFIAFRQYGRQFAARKPLTAQHIESLLRRLEDSGAGSEDAVGAPPGEEASILSGGVPCRLEAIPEPNRRFGKTGSWTLRRARAEATLYRLSETITTVVSPDEVGMWAWERGKVLLDLKEFDEAQRCLWTALEADVSPHITRDSAARLAWLEKDPSTASLYLELSCEGDRLTYLSDALQICLDTGSKALAEHYLARLRMAHPQFIQRSTHFQGRLDEAGIAWRDEQSKAGLNGSSEQTQAADAPGAQ